MNTWLNYHHLRYFVAVIEEGGVAAAADAMGVSHPTISEQLRKLQDDLGLKLLVKQGRHLELTEAGQMVYEYASQIFGIGSALMAAVDGKRMGRSVTLRVGVDSVLPKLAVRHALTPTLDAFGLALRLQIVEDGRDGLLAKLAGRQLDLVLSDAPAHLSPDHTVRSDLIEASPVELFAAPTLARKLGEKEGITRFDGAPFLMPMPGTRLRRELEAWSSKHDIRPVVVAEIEDSALIKALGRDGRGIFAMPSSLSRDIREQYHVLKVSPPMDIEVQTFAITSASSRQNKAVRHLLDVHEERAPADGA